MVREPESTNFAKLKSKVLRKCPVTACINYSILSRLSQPRLRRPPIVGPPQFQEIFVKLDHRSKRVLNMFVNQHLFPEPGEISRKRDDVAYLSSIQVYLRELMDVLLKIVNIDALFGFGEHADEITPDLHALILVEFGVANS